jgi:hypothetical protein
MTDNFTIYLIQPFFFASFTKLDEISAATMLGACTVTRKSLSTWFKASAIDSGLV